MLSVEPLRIGEGKEGCHEERKAMWFGGALVMVLNAKGHSSELSLGVRRKGGTP